MKKFKKQVKGITLIALVVTIIVLLILAGIALNLTIGQNGIFSRAQTAEITWKNAETNEQLTMGELENWIDDSIPKPPEPISEEENYIGCYADVDGNGSIDGVIFADLAHSKTGNWNDNSWSGYSYEAETNLKQYTISGVYGIEGEGFGQNSVISPIEGSDGEDRFYVMALENFTTEEYTTFYWYYNADGKLNDTVATNYNDFGDGKQNTVNMISIWNGEAVDEEGTPIDWGEGNDRDIWGVIQEEVENGWFVPSKSEWSAFGHVFNISNSSSNDTYYGNYGLSNAYWTSSQYDTRSLYNADFEFNFIFGNSVSRTLYIRLATIF